MILFSKLMMASLLCCMNAENGDFILLPQLQESEEGKDEKLLGIIQRTSYLWNLYGLFLMSLSHSFQYFGPEVSLFRLQQGYNISYITFSLPFLG